MSDYTDESYSDTDEQGYQSEQPNWRRQLESRASKAEKALADAQASLARLERENAFAKAGVPLDDKKAAYFVKGYDGELNVEAIRKEAAEFGLIAAPAPAQDEIPADEQAAHQRMQSLAAGQETGGIDYGAEMAAARNLTGPEGKAAVLRLAQAAGVPIASNQ